MARIPTSPSAEPAIFTLKAGTRLLRLYDPSKFNAGPLTFREFGPLLRFDHHSGIGKAMKRTPTEHASRGILYAAHSLDCCITEVFGDSRYVEPGEYHLADIEVTRDLILVDLVERAMTAGTIAAISQTEHHYKAQAWSRRVYELPGYQHLDGIYYRSAHIGDLAFAFYERATDGLGCPADNTIRLDDPDLRVDLLDIARRHGLTLQS